MLVKTSIGSWALACHVNGKTLYYGAIQYSPMGSITLVRDPRDPDALKRAILFWSKKAAENVLEIIVKRKVASKYFTWEAIELPEK